MPACFKKTSTKRAESKSYPDNDSALAIERHEIIISYFHAYGKKGVLSCMNNLKTKS